MKTVTIESTVAIHYPETAMAYTSIINTIANSDSRNDLREGMNRLKSDTDAHDFFDWGFGKSHFWVHQKIGYQATEVFSNRMLIVKF